MNRFSGFATASLVLMATAPLARADDLPPGPAHDIVAKACTQCHAADLITASRKSRDDWANTVTTMMGNGAQVSDADFNKVVDYLAKSFPAN